MYLCIMNRKEIFQGIISTMQREVPFEVIDRDMSLPIDSGQIITVAGVRRCGKSSLMKIAANKLVASGVEPQRILWINFDDERLYGMQSEDLDEVLQAYREMYPDTSLKDVYIFFDEIQMVDHWELFVMRLYKTYCKNIYLSGSNADMLSSQIATALRGWPIEFEAFPLSFREYLRFKGIDVSPSDEYGRAKIVGMCREYLYSSSFPEVALMSEKSLQVRKVQGYFNTMLFRDLIEHYSLSSHETVRYFLKRMMNNVCTPVSIHSIYNDIRSQGRKADKNKMYELADAACDIFMFFKVNRWSRSMISENARLPKYYFIDNGMRNAVVMPQSEDRGSMLENAVYIQLRRNLSPMQKITYFNEVVECDFVVQTDEEIQELIQVSWTLQEKDTLERELRGIKAASEATGCKNCKIITFEEADSIIYEGLGIEIVPGWRWLLGEG